MLRLLTRIAVNRMFLAPILGVRLVCYRRPFFFLQRTINDEHVASLHLWQSVPFFSLHSIRHLFYFENLECLTKEKKFRHKFLIFLIIFRGDAGSALFLLSCMSVRSCIRVISGVWEFSHASHSHCETYLIAQHPFHSLVFLHHHPFFSFPFFLGFMIHHQQTVSPECTSDHNRVHIS